jgi:hypothetical protein
MKGSSDATGSIPGHSNPLLRPQLRHPCRWRFGYIHARGVVRLPEYRKGGNNQTSIGDAKLSTFSVFVMPNMFSGSSAIPAENNNLLKPIG